LEDRIKIHTDNIELDKLDFDIFDFTNPDKSLMEDIPKLDFEEL